MALVAGIFKRFEHLAITPRAADVFGRTAAGRLDQARIEDVGFGGAMRSTLIVCSQPSP